MDPFMQEFMTNATDTQPKKENNPFSLADLIISEDSTYD